MTVHSLRRQPDAEYTQRWSHLPYFGTRAQVFHGHARYTRGFLRRDDLVKNSKSRIVSKTASEQAQKLSHLGHFVDLTRENKGSFRVMHKNGVYYDAQSDSETGG